MERDVAIAELARQQAGVVTREQLLALGLSSTAINYRLRGGTLLRSSGGVYIVASHPAGFLRDATAALFRCDGAVLAREWAGAWWELLGFPRESAVGPVEAVAPQTARSRTDVLRIERSRAMLSEDIVPLTEHEHAVVVLAASERRRIHRGGATNVRRSRKPATPDRLRPAVAAVVRIPTVTTPARTVIDLARTWNGSVRKLDALIDDTIARGLVTIRELGDCLERCLPPRAPGRIVIAHHLDKRGGGFHAPDSELERIGREAFRAWGCPAPTLNHPIPGREHLPGRVDFAFPSHRVLIELDGRRWHLTEHGFQVDRSRDRVAMLANWRPFRYTWADFTTYKASTEEQIKTLFPDSRAVAANG